MQHTAQFVSALLTVLVAVILPMMIADFGTLAVIAPEVGCLITGTFLLCLLTRGNSTVVRLFGWLFGFSCLTVLLWHDSAIDSPVPGGTAILSCVVFLLLTETITRLNRQRLEAISQEQTHLQLIHTLEEQLKTQSRKPETKVSLSTNSGEKSIDFAMLLFTMQNVGKRVSANLDVETLYPTILTTAKALSASKQEELALWSRFHQRFYNPQLSDSEQHRSLFSRVNSHLIQHVVESRQVITKEVWLSQSAQRNGLIPDAVAPLCVGEELLGLLILHELDEPPGHLRQLLHILANLAALGIKNAQLFQRIHIMARRDGLTGLLNHVTFQQELNQRVSEALLAHQPLSLILGDIDHFKSINDNHGHQVGDHVLQEVARLWEAIMPDHAILARYGGEEFVVILPGEPLQRGQELAELLRKTMSEYGIDFEGREYRVTASFGVSTLRPGADHARELIRLADQALYQAKHGGRNRVICAGSESASEDQPLKESAAENTSDAK